MNKVTKALTKSFIVNMFLTVLKILIGIIGKSSALIADGIHSFSDLATDSVAIFGTKYSMKPADDEHPFGHGKFEYVTSLIIAFVILLLGFEILSNAFKVEIVVPSKIVIIVSVLTIIIKMIISKYLLKIGEKEKNEILISSGKESSMDVISSIFVLISSILMQFSYNIEYLKHSNLIATIIVSILIIKTGFDVLKENISSILGEQESGTVLRRMLKSLEQEEKIETIDHFAIIKNGPYFQITGEVGMDQNLTLKEVHEVIENVEKNLKKIDKRSKYINIHVNPIEK